MTPPSDHALFRPPSEAYSLILRIADGCPWNRCTFCGMYKDVRYRAYDPAEIDGVIDEAVAFNPGASRVFLADGDVMALPYEELHRILSRLNDGLPQLARVSLYANGRSILDKSEAQLRELRDLKLQTLYMGLESGDDETLRRVRKRETAEEMCRAGIQAEQSGLRMSVMILIGLGGRRRWAEHATATAAILNRMQPRLLAALRVIPVPGTPLHKEAQRGEFEMLTEHEAVTEVRECVAGLELDGTVFRANHTSNIVPLGGRFPKDKERLLQELDALLGSGRLDKDTPGRTPMAL